MGVGRPTKYNGDETIERTAEYFFDSMMVAEDRVPSIEGLAVYLGVDKNTVYAWMDRHPEFLSAIKRGEAHQTRAIVNLLTDKDRYTQGAIFVAKNILGWKDKVEQDNVSSDGSMATGKPTKIELVAYEGEPQ